MRRLSLLLLLVFLAFPASAQTRAALTPALTAKDKKDIARIETYLNDLKSIHASFTQINDNGEFRNGDIDILRPGKMRVAYAPPQRDLIVADGNFVYMWDDEMQQQSSMPLGSSLADFILRDPIKLDGDVTITKFERFPAKLELSLVSAKDPQEGQLTLIFEDKPLQLRQWRVVDAQGRTTGVNLENVHEGVPLDPHNFVFIAPTFGKPQKGNAR